jgi:hypothetical protein
VIYPMVAKPILFQSPAMDIVALFCDLDDFYQAFAPTWQQHLLPAPGRHRRRASRLSPSEVMTLVIAFQDSDYRTFKHFYRKEVCRYWRAEFPHLVSYPRLIECLPAVLVPLAAYKRVWAARAALPLSIACPYPCVTTAASTTIRCLPIWHNEEKAAWAGSTVSSGTL